MDKSNELITDSFVPFSVFFLSLHVKRRKKENPMTKTRFMISTNEQSIRKLKIKTTNRIIWFLFFLLSTELWNEDTLNAQPSISTMHQCTNALCYVKSTCKSMFDLNFVQYRFCFSFILFYYYHQWSSSSDSQVIMVRYR